MWLRFLVPGEHPVLDRLLALVAQNQNFGDDRVIARLLQQQPTGDPPAPAPVEPETPVMPRPPATVTPPTPWFVIADAHTVIRPAPTEDEAPLAAGEVETPAPQDLPLEPEERGAILFGGTFEFPLTGTGANLIGQFAVESRFVVLYNDMLDPGLVVDRNRMTVMPGGIGDIPELGKGDDDTLVLSGDFSSGWALPRGPDIDTLIVTAGFDYNFIAADGDVGAGETLTVNAGPLLDANHILFDGSAERDGRFIFYGGDAADIFLGGAGNDRIVGRGGGDLLAGGGGRDEFVYAAASDSTGADYDSIGDFNAAQDRIDVMGRVSGFAATVTAGALSQGSFASDLAAASGGLGASQAMWFAPDAGDLAGKIFLVVDTNGVAGYQDGEDLVIAIGGAPLADLTGNTDIFI